MLEIEYKGTSEDAKHKNTVTNLANVLWQFSSTGNAIVPLLGCWINLMYGSVHTASVVPSLQSQDCIPTSNTLDSQRQVWKELFVDRVFKKISERGLIPVCQSLTSSLSFWSSSLRSCCICPSFSLSGTRRQGEEHSTHKAKMSHITNRCRAHDKNKSSLEHTCTLQATVVSEHTGAMPWHADEEKQNKKKQFTFEICTGPEGSSSPLDFFSFFLLFLFSFFPFYREKNDTFNIFFFL